MIAWRGFTIVELMVVMVVMAILLTLGVAQFNGSQATARNTERSSDVETIAKGLEARYNRGNPYATASYIGAGSYPSIYEIQHAEGATISTITPTSAAPYIDKLLPGTVLANFYPPNADTAADISTTFKVICTTACGAAEVTATRTTALGASSKVYVYEPITSDNQVCLNSECVRYNLYYITEGTNTIVTETSKHQ